MRAALVALGAFSISTFLFLACGDPPQPSRLGPTTGKNNSSSSSGGGSSSGNNGSSGSDASVGKSELFTNNPTLDFSTIATNQDSAPATITFHNRGNAPTGSLTVNLSGTNLDAFAINSGTDTCSGKQLGQDDTCTVDVVFHPNALGPNSAKLTVKGSASESIGVDLTGTGVTPSTVTFTPPTKAFPLTVVNGTSAPQQFTIENKGGTSAGLVTDIVLSNNGQADYTLQKGTCEGATLPPGGTCTLTITFKPISAGVKSTVIQLHTQNASLATASITGTGGEPPNLTAPLTLNFEDVANGTNKDLTINIGNSGQLPTSQKVNTALQGGAAGDYSVTANTCQNPVLPGGNQCTITVRFQPTALGDRSSTLNLNAGNTTASVQLTGQSKAPAAITATLTNDGFELQGRAGAPGGKKVYKYRLTNTGELSTGPVTITGTGGGNDWKLENNTCTNTVLQGNQLNNCTVDVVFEPDNVGGPSNYTVTANATPGGPHAFKGRGGSNPPLSETSAPHCDGAVGSECGTTPADNWCSASEGCTPKADANVPCANDYQCKNGCDEAQGRCN